jgi:hypothetical protein
MPSPCMYVCMYVWVVKHNNNKIVKASAVNDAEFRIFTARVKTRSVMPPMMFSEELVRPRTA